MNILELAILKKMVGGGGGSGTDNYNDLSNLPQINGETLAGNKTAENLGLQDALTFDSEPTEGSTNPVESGGVYNALAGKQDNLTFDDDPTENSTNPVKSGGVYSALAGKQDNLTFDGVYSASTNKAATESTVTNAIAGLDVSDFSVDADETISSISETDGKVSVTKQDIAIASNQVVAMTGYTKPSSAPANPAIQTNDTANQAFGKLEFKADTNQSNILYTLGKTGKNIFDFDAWIDGLTVTRGTFATSGNSITITATGNDCSTDRWNSRSSTSPVFKIPTKAGEVIILQWNADLSQASNSGTVYIFPNGSSASPVWTYASSTKITFTVPSGCEFITFRFGVAISGETITYSNIMICTQEDWNVSPDYQPYRGLPNYDLTVLEAEDRAALAEVVDSGAKNLMHDIEIIDNDTSHGVTYTLNSDGTITVNGTPEASANSYVVLRCADENIFNWLDGKHVLSGCPVGGSFENGYSMYLGMAGYLRVDDGSGVVMDAPTESISSVNLVIRVMNGTTANNLVFKPMICNKVAWDITHKFVPYKQDPFYQIPINHNMIYRGRNLGATLTDAQHTALSSGNFTDLYLGDYWTKTVTIPAGTYTGGDGEEVTVPAQTTITLKAVIADFDTFYAGYASTYASINTHHAAVIVTGFSNVVWNKTNSTAGGYVASLIHKWLVGSVLPQIETWFGSAKVLSHQKLLTNAITGDAASGLAWSSQKISLLSENQMYGSKIWGGKYDTGEAFKHLNVFNHIDANLLFGNKNNWLRDIASAERAAYLDRAGSTDSFDASATGIAPPALILLS